MGVTLGSKEPYCSSAPWTGLPGGRSTEWPVVTDGAGSGHMRKSPGKGVLWGARREPQEANQDIWG